jgi:[amino group carrier protein]-lysine/ornithine hydrolase
VAVEPYAESLTGIHTTVSDADAEALLHGLVNIASPSRQEHAASQYLVGWMQAHGYDDAFIDDADNAVGIIGSGTRDIVLLGHIDTFGGSLPVRVEGRTLYGRGAVDAKGALCTFAVSAANAGAQLPPDTRLIVIGAVEEEAPTSAGARYALTQYQPSVCLIGEPSRWDRITLGYKGRLVLQVEIRSGLSHSAGPSSTVAEQAVDLWTRVQSYATEVNAGQERVFDWLDATLQALNTGDDGVNGWARLTIGFRLPPSVDPNSLADTLEDLLADDGVSIRFEAREHAHVAERDTTLSRALRGAIRAEGGTPVFVHKTGTSDMNVVAREWSCPIAAYGPGDSSLDHTPEERLDLDEYLQAIRVLTRALGHPTR